jgi:hypothetical protein
MGILRLLLKDILHLLGLRRYTPSPFEGTRVNRRTYHVPDIGDTGGGWYRPAHRRQDPSIDPAEPKNESSSVGNDHGWSNCTMASGAPALEFHTQGALKKWGGDLRHKQGDMEGGTDLYDLRDAWKALGETLTIRSGAGWDALTEDRADGRFLVVQGEGNVPGAETFTGGHACSVSPETHSDGRWLFGDPLADGWQWIDRNQIKSWMQNWNSGFSYAISAAHPPSAPQPEPPKPEPEPPKPLPPPHRAPVSNLMGWQPVPEASGFWGDNWGEAQWSIPAGIWPDGHWANSPGVWGETKWAGTW